MLDERGLGYTEMCIKRTLCNISTMFAFPQSQSELIKSARGARSQAEFSRLVGCDRSCLSRYESESLGAPPHVINRCLQIVASLLTSAEQPLRPFERALTHARHAVAELELLQTAVQQPESKK